MTVANEDIINDDPIDRVKTIINLERASATVWTKRSGIDSGESPHVIKGGVSLLVFIA